MGKLHNRRPETLQLQLQKALVLRDLGVITRGLLLSTHCPKCGKFGALFSLHGGHGMHYVKECDWRGRLRDPGVMERLIELGNEVKPTHPQLSEHK